MYNHLLYVSFWIVNSLTLILAGIFASEYVTLGSQRFNNIESGVYAGFWVTFIIWAFWDFSLGRKYNLQKTYRSFMFFFLVNIFALWAVSKFKHWIGFSLQDLSWLIILALVVTFFQRFIRRIVIRKSLYSAWF